MPLFPWSVEESQVPAEDNWFWEGEKVWDSTHVPFNEQFGVSRSRPISGEQMHPCTAQGHPTLAASYIGPFTIQKQINAVKCWLYLSYYCIASTFHVSLRKPHHSSLSPSSAESGVADDPPPLLFLDDRSSSCSSSCSSISICTKKTVITELKLKSTALHVL